MTIAAGVLSQTSVSSTVAVISSTAPTSGTGPYTQQLYVSTVSGFSVGSGNLIAGATALVNTVTGLIPGTQYYFKMLYTDTGHSNDQATASQLAVATSAPTLSQNQFNQTPYLSMLDQRFNYDTVSVEIDSSQSGLLFAGAAVKIVDSAGGVPKVVGCALDSDQVFGFINYDVKTISYAAFAMAEISQAGNVMYLYATGAIPRGVQVVPDLTTNGGVQAALGATGDNIVGWSYDKATAAGQLIRVRLMTPNFQFV